MKKILSMFVVLSLWSTLPILAQETAKTYCLSAAGYQGSIDNLKADLLTGAKREAVREFFGEFISSFTKIENLRITADTIQATSLGFVRMKGDPEYYNGKNFGEACVKIQAYATAEDFAQFKPLTLTQKSCIMEGDVKTIKQDAEKKAIFEALINYDRRLETYSQEQMLPLLREVSFSGEGFVPETEVYCVKTSGVVYPIEVLGTLTVVQEKKVEETGETKDKNVSTQEKTDFTIDLTKYELGDIPRELGQNLTIGQTKKGEKYIRGLAVDPAGEIEIKDLKLSDSFEVIMKTYAAGRQGKNPAQALHILSENQKQFTLWFWPHNDHTVSAMGFGNVTKGLDRTAWRTENEVNTIKIIVKENQAKFLINDELVGAIVLEPGIKYYTVKVTGIIDYDAVYGLSVKNLNATP